MLLIIFLCTFFIFRTLFLFSSPLGGGGPLRTRSPRSSIYKFGPLGFSPASVLSRRPQDAPRRFQNSPRRAFVFDTIFWRLKVDVGEAWEATTFQNVYKYVDNSKRKNEVPSPTSTLHRIFRNRSSFFASKSDAPNMRKIMKSKGKSLFSAFAPFQYKLHFTKFVWSRLIRIRFQINDEHLENVEE